MPLVAASKKLVKFDTKTFLFTINGGRKVERSKIFPKGRRSFLRATPPMLFFIFRKER
jgi:hypothetical protein